MCEVNHWDWSYSSVVECLPSMHKSWFPDPEEKIVVVIIVIVVVVIIIIIITASMNICQF